MKKMSKVETAYAERKQYSEEHWKPITEFNEISDKEFDKRFPIDRSYLIEYPEYCGMDKSRIRFVKHPDCGQDEIRVYQMDIKTSKPSSHWIGGWMGKVKHHGYRDAKVTNSSERIMRIVDAEEKYGIKLI